MKKLLLQYKDLILYVVVGVLFVLSITELLVFTRRINNLENSMDKMQSDYLRLRSQMISTSPEETTKVRLYYYNELLDKSLHSGEVSGDSEAILPVEREIPVSHAPINDSIRLLLKGELTNMERELGFKTDYPNESLKFLGAKWDGSTLILNFEDNGFLKNSESSKASILKSEIIKTALQFEKVKNVILQPESLFR